MWCQQCQQDVPASRLVDGRSLACPRCQHVLLKPQRNESNHGDGLLNLDDRETDERMKRIGRSLRSPLASGGSGLQGSVWLDAPHVATPQHRAPHHRSHSPTQAGRRARRGELRVQMAAWFATVFGSGLATGGVVLMGMGLFGEQPEFWQWGIGVTLAGQAILIAGLIRVLLSLWNSSRSAARRLVDVEQELAQVQRTADSLLAQRPGGPSGFYGELARGASPALLLANLKGQIDHLATRLHVDG